MNGVNIRMDNKLKSSVVIALYNGERFILDQLRTIKAQSRRVDEVIICDDGSTDNSVLIVYDFIQNNNLQNWKIKVNSYNKGYALNFIDMLKEAQNEIVFLCDQDDLWKNNKIELMMSVMEKNDNINLLCGDNDFQIIEGSHSRTETMETNNMQYDGSIEHVLATKRNMHIQRSGCLMCVRKSFFSAINSFWIPGWAHDDFLWKFSMIDESCYYLHSLTITRRLHQNNTSKNSGKQKNRSTKGRIKQLNEMKRQNNSVLEYLRSFSTCKKRIDKIAFFETFNKSLDIRIKFLQTKNPIFFLKLYFRYQEYYPRIPGLYLDFAIVYLGEKICQKF